MGNSTISSKTGYNTDNSLISIESRSNFYDIINSEEELMNYIHIKKRFKKQQQEEEKINTLNNNDSKNNKIPTMFEWSFKGNSVYLTGSFCNWKQFFLMKKDETGIYRLILDLKRGFHQYKFKIDNEWKYNINFPLYNDHGFINNYIDTSNWEINGEYEKVEVCPSLFSTSEIDIINHMKEKDFNLKLSKEFINSTVNYCNYKPLKMELFNNAQQFPYQSIMECINKQIYINKDKKDDKNKNICKDQKSEDKKKDGIIIEDKNDDKMILYCIKNMHEQINHLHLKKIKVNKIMKISVISRFKLKFTTFIYYK